MAEIIFTDLERQGIARLANLPYSWNKLRNSTVLISGGTGFIGSHLIAVIKERNQLFGDNISIICLSRGGGEEKDNVKFIKCDVSQEVQIQEQVDYIVHLASNTHPEQYAKNPIETITTNVLGCNNLLKLATRKKAKRFLLASSVEIYGDGTDKPMSESYCGCIDCNTVRAGYNEAKRLSESMCQAYRQQFGVDCVVARFARVFGADRKPDSKAMAQFIEKAVQGEDIVLKSDGKQRYSYCYLLDAVSGLLKVLMDGVSGEAYNIANDDIGYTLGDYAEYIANIAGRKVVFDLENGQAGASKVTVALLDCAKLKALGWSQISSVLSGIDKTYYIKRSIVCANSQL